MKHNNEAIQISRIEAWSFRQPVDRPVSTSFGTMIDRPAVFVRIEDKQGCFGWGEIFANWPAAGAEHRVNLLIQDIADLVFESAILAPSDLFNALSQKTHIRAMQCGEMGPFRQVIAGLDTAVWDLFARQAKVPVRQLLNPGCQDQVPCYASGINIRDADHMINQARKHGFNAFKVKVGFDFDADIRDLKTIISLLDSNEQLFADANQAWDVQQAINFIERLDGARLGWLEEPIAVDAADKDWSTLASQSSVPLAGGENIAGNTAFNAALGINALSVYQPDIAKWGGFTGCFEIAKKVRAAGRRYCPHFLGGGIGLIASAHLLAATGGDGLLEVDVNNNELRDGFEVTANCVKDGMWQLDGSVGLGIHQMPDRLMSYKTHYRSAERSSNL
jgi:D-galactarolactone cycloisomerase